MEEPRAFPDFLLDTSALARRKKTQFNYRLDADQLKALKEELDLSALRKVSFAGNLSAAGKHDWVLEAEIGATAVQPCTITLEPVTTRVKSEVIRRFVAELPDLSKETEEDEFGGTAMLDDDTLEPLGREIDLWRVLQEGLALALPDYPRIDGAQLGTLSITEPGSTALSDEDLKPFAGLAALKGKLESKS
ncbi:MAG: DUF177 domain-containing protein [Planktotalea sp.]|uniref:YceD family protein n=1 Tax=Planktotalea sp. TaxID=2029877 RepID=UPI003C7180DD